MRRLIVSSALVITALLGCDSKKGAGAKLSPSGSVPAVSAVPAKLLVKYVIDPKGKTSIDMPTPIEHIKASTNGAAGDLDVDLSNLANSRGQVKIDLTTLVTKTFDDAAKDKKQTEAAQIWLEASDKLSDEVKKPNRFAVFSIRSIEGTGQTDPSKIAATKEGDEDVRVASVVAKGDFVVHGAKVGKDAEIEIKLHYPAGAAPGSKPTSIDVYSKKPMHVVLAEHDVKPRDDLGKVAKEMFKLLGTKVAEVADVWVDLRATPAP